MTRPSERASERQTRQQNKHKSKSIAVSQARSLAGWLVGRPAGDLISERFELPTFRELDGCSTTELRNPPRMPMTKRRQITFQKTKLLLHETEEKLSFCFDIFQCQQTTDRPTDRPTATQCFVAFTKDRDVRNKVAKKNKD